MKRAIPCFLLVLLLVGCTGNPLESRESSFAVLSPVTSEISDTVPAFSSENAENQPDTGYLTCADSRYKRFFQFSFAESDDLYVGTYLLDEYVHYYDKASGVGGVLCGNPACMHKDDTCDGFVGEPNYGMTFYDGKLYWLGQNEKNSPLKAAPRGIWRMNPDGTERESLEIDGIMSFFSDKQFQSMAFHKGKVYFLVTEDYIDEGVPHSYCCLYDSDLGDLKTYRLLLKQETESSPTVSAIWTEEQIYVNCRLVKTSGLLSDWLMVYRPETEQTETLLSVSESQFDFFDFQVASGEIYYAGSEDGQAAVYHLVNGKLDKCCTFPDDGISFETAVLSNDMAVSIGADEKGQYVFWFKDFRDETLYRGYADWEALGINPDTIWLLYRQGGDRNSIIFAVDCYVQRKRVYSFIRFHVSQGELQQELLMQGMQTVK